MIPFLKALMLLALAFASPLAAQAPVPAKANNIAAELVAQGPVKPGEELELALLFRPQPGWHGYWSNPGDAGLGMTLDWQLPEGWEAGQPLYPVPQTLLIAGLMNHVYEGDHAVIVPLKVPAGIATNGIYPVEVEAHWLACTDKICVPEQATLTLRLSGQASVDARFDGWRSALPPLIDQPARFELTSDTLRIAIPLPASLELANPHLFLGNERLIDYAAPQVFRRSGDWLVAELRRKGGAASPETVSGILKLDDQDNGVTFAGPVGEVPTGGEIVGGGPEVQLAPLWLLLGGALLGGLVLNLMPCVFPILSLKALSLARAGESAAGARREGIAYTVGVVLACVALGALLLVLRAAGSEIGWAFQLQEPGVVVALLALATALTANFAGIYEFPSMSFTRSGGQASAFSTGLLAAFVATPCVGPFLAAAMGAALLLPWWQGLLLFATLGLGLALPFLLLGYIPALRRLLPKPGGWMNTFRRILSVPMGLTALALLWLTWRLGGPWFAAVALVIAVAVVAALAGWGKRLTLVVGGSLAVAAISSMLLPRLFAPSASSDAGLLTAQPFSEAALAEARASGKPVFLWFTADWCLTCKVNENVAIERESTKAAFEKAGVVPMRGDWTRRDPEITRFLTAHGVAGVPLYLWYAPGKNGEVMPQVLTPDMLSELAEQG